MYKRKWLVKTTVGTSIKQQIIFHPTLALSTQKNPCLVLLYILTNMYTHGPQNVKEPEMTNIVRFSLIFEEVQCTLTYLDYGLTIRKNYYQIFFNKAHTSIM